MTAAGPRNLFALPEVDRPVGGVNVLMQMAGVLSAAGHKCGLLYGTRGYRYAFQDSTVPAYAAGGPFWTAMNGTSPRRDVGERLRRLVASPEARHPRASPGRTDLLVAPEYRYPEVMDAYPDVPCVVVAQDWFGFARAFGRDGGGRLRRAVAVVTTSEASDAAVRALTGAETLPVRLHVGRPGLDPAAPKRMQMAYMPRKRGHEATTFTAVARALPDLAGLDMVPVSNVSEAELVRLLNESMFFLSLSEQEGFGLPPAEALLAGCVVIGYTGVGGREYLDGDTGIVVSDGDMFGLLDATRDAVRRLRSDPTAFDATRARGAERIRARYTRAAFEASVLKAWREIGARLALAGAGALTND